MTWYLCILFFVTKFFVKWWCLSWLNISRILFFVCTDGRLCTSCCCLTRKLDRNFLWREWTESIVCLPFVSPSLYICDLRLWIIFRLHMHNIFWSLAFCMTRSRYRLFSIVVALPFSQSLSMELKRWKIFSFIYMDNCHITFTFFLLCHQVREQ